MSLEQADERVSAVQDLSIRGRLVSGAANPVDVHVGSRLRERRLSLGLTQGVVGQALGLTFQQIQKYEAGVNRISASRLWDISGVLKCAVAFFFEDMDASSVVFHRRNLAQYPDDVTGPKGQRAFTDEAIDLIRAYYDINGDRTRRQIYNLVQALAAEQASL